MVTNVHCQQINNVIPLDIVNGNNILSSSSKSPYLSLLSVRYAFLKAAYLIKFCAFLKNCSFCRHTYAIVGLLVSFALWKCILSHAFNIKDRVENM